MRKIPITARFIAAATVAASVAIVATVGPASAEEASPEAPVVEQTNYSADRVEDGLVENGALADKFVAEQASSGRLVDEESVNTAVLPAVTIVYEDGT